MNPDCLQLYFCYSLNCDILWYLLYGLAYLVNIMNFVGISQIWRLHSKQKYFRLSFSNDGLSTLKYGPLLFFLVNNQNLYIPECRPTHFSWILLASRVYFKRMAWLKAFQVHYMLLHANLGRRLSV